MRRAGIAVALSLLLLGSLQGGPALAASSHREARTLRVDAPGLWLLRNARPGDLIRAAGAGVMVQRRGGDVTGYFDRADGSGVTLDAETRRDGNVVVRYMDSRKRTRPRQAIPYDTSECGDSYYAAVDTRKWTGSFQWYLNANSIPSELDVDNTETALRASTTNITHEVNNCGRSDTVSATVGYQGRTTNGVNISTDGSCFNADGQSVTGFGDLPSSYIATTCNWGNPRTESDTRFNKYDYQFVVNAGSGCSGKYYVEGMGTHEHGHTWDLNDDPSGHPNLTMGGANAECSGPDDKATLGLGDMLGLEVNY